VLPSFSSRATTTTGFGLEPSPTPAQGTPAPPPAAFELGVSNVQKRLRELHAQGTPFEQAARGREAAWRRMQHAKLQRQQMHASQDEAHVSPTTSGRQQAASDDRQHAEEGAASHDPSSACKGRKGATSTSSNADKHAGGVSNSSCRLLPAAAAPVACGAAALHAPLQAAASLHAEGIDRVHAKLMALPGLLCQAANGELFMLDLE